MQIPAEFRQALPQIEQALSEASKQLESGQGGAAMDGEGNFISFDQLSPETRAAALSQVTAQLEEVRRELHGPTPKQEAGLVSFFIPVPVPWNPLDR